MNSPTFRRSYSIWLLLIVSLGQGVIAQDLSDYQLTLVEGRLDAGAKLSWELGTRAQALTEAHAPLYSVLSPNTLPPPTLIPSNISDAMSTILGIAKNVVSNRAISNGNIVGPQPLIKDDAAADPASLGVTVLIANWTGQGAKDNLDYAGAAKDQLDFLLYNVPRTSDGAISHRVYQTQLWSDFVYMVPPFMAYYAVLSNNATLLQQSYDQISLYRNYLRDPSANNLWKHVLMGGANNSDPDPQHWSTGNGWAAAGMLRVLSTIKNSQFSSSFQQQQNDLASWVLEIQAGMYANIDSTNIFKNWVDLKSDSNFYDASSTAIMASTVYRLSLIWGTHTYLPHAELSRHALASSAGSFPTEYSTPYSSPPPTSSAPSASSTGNISSVTGPSPVSSSATGSIPVSSSVNRTTTTLASIPRSSSSALSGFISLTGSITGSASILGGVPSSSSAVSSTTSTSTSVAPGPTSTASALQYFTDQGWLTPVCNPHSFGSEGSESAEAQAFIVEMTAAWKDWVADGTKGANGAIRSSGSTTFTVCIAVALAMGILGQWGI